MQSYVVLLFILLVLLSAVLMTIVSELLRFVAGSASELYRDV